MERIVIFGAATGGKEVANKLLNNGGGGRRIRFCSLSIMTPKNTDKHFVFKIKNMR